MTMDNEQEEVTALKARLAALEDDAYRFRWLLNQADWECDFKRKSTKLMFEWSSGHDRPRTTDVRKHIDAARACQGAND